MACHPRNLISVDPGTHAAWCLWERLGERRWTPVRVGREPAPTVGDCRRILRGLLPSWREAALVVEGQFYTPRKGFSPWNDVATLIELRCRWEDAAVLEGAAEVLVAAPGTWIPALTRGAPGASSKDRIRFVVGQLLPGVPLVGDEHDAVGLGCWWVRGRGHLVEPPPPREEREEVAR